ncbi:MAG: hypothetical protein COB53_11610, partial [Elusimicrobia bacterium]
PLSAWPQLFIAAAIAAAVTGIIVYDLWTHGKLVRGLQNWWNRKGPAKDFELDLFTLFDNASDGGDRYRPEDHAIVAADVSIWKKASQEKRRVILRNASTDKELWRERLIALYIASTVYPDKKDPQLREDVLSEIIRAKTKHLKPLAPILDRVFSKRRFLDWLSHPSVLQPLDSLARESLGRSPVSTRAPPKRSFLQKTGLVTAVLVLTALIGAAGFSGVKTGAYLEKRIEVTHTSLRIFYADDFFIFSDTYNDERIPKKVLPILKKWHKTGRVSEEQLLRAIVILRDSPDSKADNILEAIFKKADNLPFNDNSEALLLRTLMERDNDLVWKFLQEYMQTQAKNPTASKRLIRMIKIGAEVGSDKVFNNLFFFLRSPNQQVRGEAAKAITASLMNPARETEFLQRLNSVSIKHEKDPHLQLWVEFFVLKRLAADGAEKLEMNQVGTLLTRVLKAAKAADTFRMVAIQQIKPGEENKLPPPVLEMALEVMQRSLDQAKAAGEISDAQAISVEKQIVRIVNDILLDGFKIDTSIKRNLQKDGILKADATPTYNRGEYDDYHGHGHGMMGMMGHMGMFGGYMGGYGASSPSAVLQKRYTMKEYRAIQAAIEKAKADAGDIKDQSPEAREFYDRATRLLDAAIAAAEKAGVVEGDTPEEAVAADLNPILQKAQQKLPKADFIAMLRKADLAPRLNMKADKVWAYETGYDYKGLEGAHARMKQALEEGQTIDSKGAATDLNWEQKRLLLESMVQLDTLIDKHFPNEVRPANSSQVLPNMRALTAALADGDAEAQNKATQALEDEYNRETVKDIFWLRFEAAFKKETTDAIPSDAIRLWTLEFAIARATGPDAEKLDAKGFEEMVKKVAPHLLSGGSDAKALNIITEALKNPDLKGELRDALTKTVESETKATIKRLDDMAKDALGADSEAYLKFHRALNEKRVIVKNNLNTNREYRKVIKRFHIRAFRDAITIAAEAPTPADADKQKALKEWAPKVLESLEAAADAAGIDDGGSVEERLGDELRDILYGGYRKFPGQDFNRLLEEAGLAPAGTGSVEKDEAYYPTYSAQELKKVYDFYQNLLATGKGWGKDTQGADKTIDTDDLEYVTKALEQVFSLMEKFHPDQIDSLGVRPLGRVMKDLDSSDAATRGAAEAEVRARIDAVTSAESLVAQLEAVRSAHPTSLAVQKRVASEVLSALSGPLSAGIAVDSDAEDLFDAALEEIRKHGRAEEVALWKSVESALAAAPGANGQALRDFVKEGLLNRFTDAVEEAEEALSSKAAMVKKGLRKNTWTHINTLKRRHIASLETEIAAEAAKAKANGALTAEQQAVAADGKTILPLLRGIGDAAGLKTGDSAGERAAVEVTPILHEGYMKWPAQSFLKKLRAESFAPAKTRGNTIDTESAYNESFTKEELGKIRDFLQRELDSGVVPNYDSTSTSPMGTDKKEYLEGAIKTIEALIENYPTDIRKMHSFMGGAGLLSVVGFADVITSVPGIVVFAMAAVFFGLWALRSLRSGKTEGTEISGHAPPTRGPSSEVIARAKRLDIMARRLATRINAAQFKSRFVGSSGESREGIIPYTNQDVRKIDWKQTAKRDKLQVSRYKQEKDMPLMLIIDVSDSASMGRKGVDKRTVVEDAAALLALTAAHKNIPVGAIFFSNKVEGFLPPSTGKKAAHRLLSRMMSLEPTGSGTEVAAGIQFLQRSLGSRAMVAVISDFLSGDFEGPLASIAARHDVRAIRALDPSELQPLPDVGLITIRDAESGEFREVDTSNAAVRAEQSSKIRSRERRLAESFERNRVRPITLFTDADYVTDLASEFRSKKGK